MSRKKDISREEIVKQFILPERQSKIDTLLKQDGQAYCICRSSDSSRFMIACDACEEWYHGDCMNISEKDAKLIKNYICLKCTTENPTLSTRWKNTTTTTKSTINDDERRARKRQKLRPTTKEKKRSKRGDSSSDNDQGLPDYNLYPRNQARQCYGPTCLNSARAGSKYCSDTCGLQLATTRILQVLPQRIQEWSLAPCVAEEKNIKELDLIRKQQMDVRQNLQKLDKKHENLDKIIELSKSIKIQTQQDYEQNDDEQSMYCITCGLEINSKSAIKHMEKCFIKYESQSTFDSKYKTRIEGNNMFCDYFNTNNLTYCKRLRVLCPEHSKLPKIMDYEICSYPLVKNVFELTGQYCSISKKLCLKHYQWEKLRRAEIDLERVRQWLKMDELLEKERQIRLNMSNRAGVLGLMLHSTYNHDIMERFTKATKQDRQVLQQELVKRFQMYATK